MSDPTSVGRYKVVSRLGQGAMGALFLAHDPIIDRMVAIKVMREGADNPELRERFAREARAAGRLRHPNIVTIFDVGEENGHPFIAMEYVPGDTLKAIIHRPARLPLSAKLKLIEELCDGLSYAHKSGLVHRDIKPANLMVDSDGVLKILDFGIVRLASSGMTQAGMLVGTLPYMSPEQIAGKPIDHRSDIFAVGDVAYELLSHKQAFPGSLDDGIMGRVLHSAPQPLEQLVPGLDPEIVTIVAKALEKEPARRYQDLTKMRRDVARVRDRLEKDEEADLAPTQQFPAARPAAKRPADPTGSSSAHGTKSPARRDMELRRQARIKDSLEAAERALAGGDFQAAISAAEEAALLDPANERSMEIVDKANAAIEDRQVFQWLEAAREFLIKGEPTEAAGLVDRARALRPSSPDVSLVQRNVEDVRREIELARERAHIVGEATARARSELAASAFESAIRAADEALARQPDHAEALEIKRQAAAALEEQRKREAFERAAADALDNARREFAAGNHDQALAILQRFQEPHPAIHESLASMRREATEIARRKVAALMAACQQAADKGQHDEALGLLDRVRELDPQAPGLDVQRRKVLDLKAAAEKAARNRALVERKIAEAIAALHQDDLRTASRLHQEATRLDAADSAVKAFTETFRRQLATRVAEARKLAGSRKFDDAIQILESVRPFEGETGDAHTLLSEVQERKAAAEAEERRRAAVVQKIADAAAASQRREMARAARLCDEALKLDPDNQEAAGLAAEIKKIRDSAKAHLAASQEAIGKREFRAALEEIDRARSIDPDATGLGMLAERAAAGLGELEREERRQQEIRTALAAAVGRLEASDPTAAMSFVQEALRLDAANGDAKALREKIQRTLDLKAEAERQEAERQQREATIAKTIRKAQKARSHDAALRILHEALEIDSHHDELRAAIAEREAAKQADNRKSGVILVPPDLRASTTLSGREAPSQITPGTSSLRWIALAAAATLVVAVIGYWALSSGGETPQAPPQQGSDAGTTGERKASEPPAAPSEKPAPPPAASSAASSDPGASSGTPSSGTPATSTAAPPQPVTPEPSTDPAAASSVPADPDAVEKQIDPLRRRARLQFARREFRGALASAEGGLNLNPNDPALRSIIASMVDEARRDALSARDEAARAEAPKLAAPTFEEANKRARAAQNFLQGGRIPIGIRGLWEARDLFNQAAGEARQAAQAEEEEKRKAEEARKAAAAATRNDPPPRTDPPPSSNPPPPKPETKPATPSPRTDPGPTRPAGPIDERQNILRTLQQYEAAHKARSVDQLRSVWELTPAQARGLQDTFSKARSYEAIVIDPQITIGADGTSATVVAKVRRILDMTGAASQDLDRTTQNRFTLQKRGGSWVITDLR